MANQWFKLYGGEYLSDPKMLALSAPERSCWLTLLCYASLSDDGVIRYMTEEKLFAQSGILPMTETWENTKGVLKKFESLKMITNDASSIVITNWEKRQSMALTPYERTKRYRNKAKHELKIKARASVQIALRNGKLTKGLCEVCGDKNTEAHHDSYAPENWLKVRWLCKDHHEVEHSVTDDDGDDDARVDKNRIDKSRVEYLDGVPEEDIKEFIQRFVITEKEVISKAEDLKLYCQRKGKRYSNYKAFLLNAIKRDHKERGTEKKGKYDNI